jgi:hypothetical protein
MKNPPSTCSHAARPPSGVSRLINLDCSTSVGALRYLYVSDLAPCRVDMLCGANCVLLSTITVPNLGAKKLKTASNLAVEP